MTKDIGILTGEVLVFGGVYSNLEALVAVQAFAKTRGIPAANVICTGDIVGYCANPTEAIEVVRDWGIHAIAGNVEMNIREGIEDCGCNFDENSRCDIFSRIWYPFAFKNSSTAAIEYMKSLPEYLTFDLALPSNPIDGDQNSTAPLTPHGGEPGRQVLVLHGNYEATSEFVWRSSDWKTFKAPAFANTGVDTIVSGHSGLPFAHKVQDKLWLNSGALGMPANDGTQRVWCATLNTKEGAVDVNFHGLEYDYKAARRKMLDNPLPKSYALTLDNGLWDNTEIMLERESRWTGFALDAKQLKQEASGAPSEPTTPTGEKKKRMEKQYFDPKDLKKFGRINEHQPEMGKQFFEWYENATYGETALTAREKALIALAVSHSISCPWCVDSFTTNCLENGADEEQMMEAVHVASAIKAGSTLISSVQMIKQAEKLGM